MSLAGPQGRGAAGLQLAVVRVSAEADYAELTIAHGLLHDRRLFLLDLFFVLLFFLLLILCGDAIHRRLGQASDDPSPRNQSDHNTARQPCPPSHGSSSGWERME